MIPSREAKTYSNPAQSSHQTPKKTTTPAKKEKGDNRPLISCQQKNVYHYLVQTPGQKITCRLGKVKGETILKMSPPRFIVREVSEPSAEQIKAKDTTIKQMIQEAEEKGANAIIGVEIRYGRTHEIGLFILAATGEAAEI